MVRIIEKKQNSAFENFCVEQKSSGILFNETPLFTSDGKSLLVSSGAACHVYNTATGDHVKTLYTADSNIITCQLHPLDSELLILTTADGQVIIVNLQTESVKSKVTLKLNALILRKYKCPKFNVEKQFVSKGDYEENINWQDAELNSKRKFMWSWVQQINHTNSPSELLIWATWSLPDEYQAHISVFYCNTGEHCKRINFSRIALKKCNRNFVVGSIGDTNVFVGMASCFVYVATFMNSSNYKYVSKMHLIGHDKEITCVAIHPKEVSFATGDSLGRIIIWRNIVDAHPLKDIYHWHTLPVVRMVFSEYGSSIFSGGDECVVVKWSLESQNKAFLPRLSAPIRNLAICSSLFAISTTDHKILLVNPNFNAIATIQHFSKWSALGSRTAMNIFTVDPRTDSFVLNGKTGHLQFLSSSENGRFLYTLDVTNRNFITREREIAITNVEVTHAQFNKSGKWLITAESREDELSSESRLKFWGFDESQQSFVLNTDIELPHGRGGIYALEMSGDDTLATTGPDRKYKLWSIVESHALNRITYHWSLLSAATYRQLDPFAVHFSTDASLIAVSFGPTTTVWDTNHAHLKCCLTPPFNRDKVKTLKFGSVEFSHIVVTGTDSHLNSWNLISLCMLWTVPFKLSLLVRDPFSSYMCAFSTSNRMVMFSPTSEQPECNILIAGSQVRSGNFVLSTSNDNQKSRLHFINADQELFSFDDSKGMDSSTSLDNDVTKKFTPFSAQIAQVTKQDVKQKKKVQTLRKLGSEFAASILDSPAHTLPSPALLCSDILKSLILITGTSPVPSKQTPSLIQNDEIMEVASSLGNKNSNSGDNTSNMSEDDLLKAFDNLFL